MMQIFELNLLKAARRLCKGTTKLKEREKARLRSSDSLQQSLSYKLAW